MVKMSRQVWRGLKFAALGAAVAGTALLLKNNDWKVSTVGVVRFGRAAWAVSNIDNDLFRSSEQKLLQ